MAISKAGTSFSKAQHFGYPEVNFRGGCTPWKINMEPTNHPFRKENHLPNLQGIMFHVIMKIMKAACFT